MLCYIGGQEKKRNNKTLGTGLGSIPEKTKRKLRCILISFLPYASGAQNTILYSGIILFL